MFSKLMKHELRASGRIMLPLGGSLLLLAVLTNITARLMNRVASSFLQISSVFAVLLFAGCCFSIGIVAVVVMISRFRNSLLTDQGYLTNTLPVSTGSLILSRLLTSMIWYVFVIVMLLVSVLAAGLGSDLYAQAGRELSGMFNGLYFRSLLSGTNLTILAAESAALLLLWLVVFCLKFYACLSIGHSFADHKGLLSTVFFFVLTVGANIVNNLMMALVNGSAHAVAEGYVLALIGVNLVVGGIYYLLTLWMLKRHLNLG